MVRRLSFRCKEIRKESHSALTVESNDVDISEARKGQSGVVVKAVVGERAGSGDSRINAPLSLV